MYKIDRTKSDLISIDSRNEIDSCIHRMSPGSKIIITLVYIITTMSFEKYNLPGVFCMLIFPVILFALARMSILEGLKRMRFVLPLVCLVGIFNPLFDRRAVWSLNGVLIISAGLISMITIMLKGVFVLMMTYLLMSTTRIEDICSCFNRLHLPKEFTTLILLSYRYLSVLVDEVSVMTQSYHLRAPGQKGLHFSSWGSFLGQLIIRTSRKGEQLYENMLLRGFDGIYSYAGDNYFTKSSWVWCIVCTVLIIVFRVIFGF